MTGGAIEPLPAPLTPADCDLRDFSFMPLDVIRLRDSRAASLPDAEAFRACVLTWCIAWHQVPAGSLPDDDATLSVLLGYGRTIAHWRDVRAAGGLHGWIRCSDGRLYHPVVAEKANEAWRKKLTIRERSRKGNAARWAARQAGQEGATRNISQEHQTEAQSHKDGESIHQGQEADPTGTAEASLSDPIGSGQNGDFDSINIGFDAEIPTVSHKDCEPVPQGQETDPARTGKPSSNDPKRQGEVQRELRSLSRAGARETAADFEAFWAAYPRKVGKEAARKAFAKARGQTSQAAIMAAIRQQRWNDDPQFIPHPATWLNQGRWQDELPTATIGRPAQSKSYAGCL